MLSTTHSASRLFHATGEGKSKTGGLYCQQMLPLSVSLADVAAGSVKESAAKVASMPPIAVAETLKSKAFSSFSFLF